MLPSSEGTSRRGFWLSQKEGAMCKACTLRVRVAGMGKRRGKKL